MSYKLLIHVNHPDPDELQSALGYVRHSLEILQKEAGKIAVVVNGPAVRFFRKDDPDFAEKIRAALRNPDVSFRLCRHALRKSEIGEHEITDGCTVIPAGIAELVRLQQAGYAYVKP